MIRKGFTLITVVVMVLWSLPYILAWIMGGDSFVFSGFLLNPIDGLSYLAKMQIGWMGEWRFALPYTAEAGQGAFLFLFYILLGHFARLFDLPIVLTYHFARLIAGFCLAWSVWSFINAFSIVNDKRKLHYFAFVLFASGLGWLFSPSIGITSDLWVAEAYPFLSGYSNPHFPLGISLILWILMEIQRGSTWKSRLLISIEGLLLSIIMPFGVVIVGVILIGNAALEWMMDRRVQLEQPLWFLIPGGGFLAYQYLAIISDPQLSQWNAQNVTLSPSIFDVLISFSPALIVAVVGIWKTRGQDRRRFDKLLLTWLVTGAILISIPFSLQRRFMAGFFIPVAILALNYLNEIKPARRFRWVYTIFLTISILTNGVILFSSWFGISTRSSALYLSKDESQGLSWLSQNIPARSLILASPQTGSFIPAFTPHRVLYGHPFETINAESEKTLVESLFSDTTSDQYGINLIKNRQVNFIFYGPREKDLGSPGYLTGLQVVYENPGVKIYLIQP